ncbi:hypothetical protein AAMO2058_000441300 [Amorphochlora amoebiformis]
MEAQKKQVMKKKIGHSVAESMDSTLRGFSNTVASRRSRSRGSGHSRERSSSWPAGSLLLGAEADQEGEKEGEEATMTLDGGKETLLDIFQPASSVMLDPNPSWKSPISEGKVAFFGPDTPTNSPNNCFRQVPDFLSIKEKGKKHNRRDSSLMREQLMRAFAEGALQSPMTTPKEEGKGWKDPASGPSKPTGAKHRKQQSPMEMRPPLSPTPSQARNHRVATGATASTAGHRRGIVNVHNVTRMANPPISVNPQARNAYERQLQMEQKRLYDAHLKLEQERQALAQQQQFLQQQAAQQAAQQMQSTENGLSNNGPTTGTQMQQMPRVQANVNSVVNPHSGFDAVQQQVSRSSFNSGASTNRSSFTSGTRSVNGSPANTGNGLLDVRHASPQTKNYSPAVNFSPSPTVFHMSTSSSAPWSATGPPVNEDELSPRTRKKMREKERRQILNAHYNTLLHMLKPQPTNRRMEKTIILEETIEMMRTLIRTNNVLKERNEKMKSEIQKLKEFKSGTAPSSVGMSNRKPPMRPGPIEIDPKASKVKREPMQMSGNGTKKLGAGTESPSEGLRRSMEAVTMSQQAMGQAQMFPKDNGLGLFN